MNARLPQGTGTQFEQDGERRLEREKTLEQERADLSLDVHENNRPFAEKVDRYIREGKADELRERMEKGEKPREFSWMTLSAYMAVGAVGAIGAYKLTTWAKSLFVSEKDEKGEEKGVIEKGKEFVENAKDFPWGWGLGLLAATGFVFRGTFFEWMQKAFNFTTDNDSLKKFVDTIRKGPDHFKEAYDQLVYDTDEPFIEYFADELDIGKRHLAELQTVGYGHFLEQREKDTKKSYLTKGMEWAGIQVDDIPFTSVDDELMRVAEENRIADYIEKHKSELGLSDDELDKLTIGEIFQKFLELKAPERTEKGKKERVKEGKEKDPEEELTITDDPEKAKSQLPETAKAIIYANENASSKEEYGVMVIEGAIKDGASLVQTEWGTFVAKGATGILISSGTMLTEAFKNAGLVVYNAKRGDTHAVAENIWDTGVVWYENGGVWFLGTGMAMGATASLWKGESIARGLTVGGLKGAFLGPVGAIWNAVKMAKAGEKGIAKAITEADYRLAQGRSGVDSWKTFWKEKPKQIDTYKDTVLYHIKEYKRYYDYAERAKAGRWRDLHVQHLDRLAPEHFERMEEYHFTQLRNNWLDYQKARGVSNPEFKFSLRDFREKKIEIDEFIEEFKREAGIIPQERTNIDDAVQRIDSRNLNQLPVSSRIEALRQSSREADEYMQTFIKNVEQMQVEGKPQTEIDAYTQEVRRNLEEIRTRYKATFEELKRNAPNMTKEEQVALKSLLQTEFSNATGVRGVLREVGGRATGKVQLIFGVAAIGLEYLEASDEQKEAYAAGKIYSWGKEFGLDVVQIIADVLSPFGASDWYTVVTGNELFTGEKASGWNRFTRVIFGAYNLGSDTLAAIGGAATAEVAGAGGVAVYGTSNTIEGALRAAGKSEKVIAAAKAIVPEVQGLAKSLGGYQELFRVMKNVAGKGMIGVAGVEVTKLGYQLMFDTKDQEPIEIDLPLADEPEETPTE